MKRPGDFGRDRAVFTVDDRERRIRRADNAHRSVLGEGVYRLGHLPTADEQIATDDQSEE